MIDSTVVVTSSPRNSVRDLVRWVAESCDDSSRVLDIGAGSSRSGPLNPLTRKKPHLVGLDPDRAIHENRSLQERHQMRLEEYAPDHPAEFDAAFAIYVLEHVPDPTAFTAACSRVLKPGGAFFGLTLNVRHYFGATTWALSRLRVSDWVLDQLKGHEHVHAHHFPPEYRLNSVRSLTRHLEAAGFSSVEFRCFDQPERYQWYLPDLLQWFPPAYARVAYRLGSAGLMGHLSFRAVK